MTTKLVLVASSSQRRHCEGRSMQYCKDAGSGPTPGYTGQTVGTASSPDTPAHPPTDTMNRLSEARPHPRKILTRNSRGSQPPPKKH